MKSFIALCLFSQLIVANAQKPIASSELEVFGDHIFIKLSVDGSDELDFIFDTGDGLTILDTDVAMDLELSMDHSKKETSAQGSVSGSLIKHNTVDMNGVRLEDDITIYATSLRHLEISIGKNIDGIIGYDLLEHYVVSLDELNKKMKLYDAETFEYTSIGEQFELSFHNNMPFVSAMATLNNDEKLEGNYFLSTGAATTVDFNTKFAEKNGILKKTGEHYSYLTKGIGNTESLHYEGRLKSFQLGKFKFENLPVGISTAKSGVQANKKMNGIIGNRILKNYILVLDKEHRSMYLERHTGTSKVFHVNACGFEIQMDPDSENMMVHRLYEKGPGKEVGMKLHDVIVSVNGVSCKDLELPEVVKIINEPGKSVTMEIVDGGEVKKITFVPKELI